MRLSVGTSSPPTGSFALIMAVSASAISFAAYSIALQPRRSASERGEDVEVYTKGTERNEKIISSAPHLFRIRPWGFANRHFASLLAQVRVSPFRGQWGKSVTRRVEHLTTPAGYDIEVEFVEPKNAGDDGVPIVIILHGINGCSREPYVEQAALHIAVEKGWRAVILNYAKMQILHEQLCSLGGHSILDGGDLNYLISYIRKDHGGFLAAVGFSMGGAKLVQYLIRTREHCNLDAACTISSPLDFTTKNDTVHKPEGLIPRAYHFIITASLKLWIVKNFRTLRKHPKVSVSKPFRRTASGLLWWIQANRVTDIDSAITIHTKGYADLGSYYNEATGLGRLRDHLHIPFLCVTAKNDPFVPNEILPGHGEAEANENIFVVNTKIGSHIGYWLPGRGCWATKGCLSFFDSVKKHGWVNPKRPKLLRRADSLRAAHNLQRTSSSRLTNYFQLIAHDSCCFEELARDSMPLEKK
mmetsp:Transcript_25584/g.75453  ORF Transcript_25584/g.75453 Transcript_25584/m.75453 type:complete len:471 (+) Transcript_25584:632-2044(+)